MPRSGLLSRTIFGSRFLGRENTPGNAGSQAGPTGGRAVAGPGAALFSPSWRRRGLNPRLAFQPAPCPLLAAALGLGAAVSPAEEEEEQAARGAAPARVSAPMPSGPGRPPAAVPPPRHHVPQSWRARRGERAPRQHPHPLPSAAQPGPSPRQPPSPACCAAEMETPPQRAAFPAPPAAPAPRPHRGGGMEPRASRISSPFPGAPASLPAPPEPGCSAGGRGGVGAHRLPAAHLDHAIFATPFNEINPEPKAQSLDCKARYNNRDGYAGSNPALVRV